MDPHDNIGDAIDGTHVAPITPAEVPRVEHPLDPANDAIEKYMSQFEQLELMDAANAKLIAGISTASDDQMRLYKAIGVIKKLQERNELGYALLVAMNNFYSDK